MMELETPLTIDMSELLERRRYHDGIESPRLMTAGT
jgi:hypothetical protein